MLYHLYFQGTLSIKHLLDQELLLHTARSGRPSGGGNGNPLYDSCPGNPTDRRAAGLQPMECQHRTSDHTHPGRPSHSKATSSAHWKALRSSAPNPGGVLSTSFLSRAAPSHHGQGEGAHTAPRPPLPRLPSHSRHAATGSPGLKLGPALRTPAEPASGLQTDTGHGL